MNFYDDVLRQLLVALGGALFVGNVFALLRGEPPARVVREAEEAGRPVPQRAPVGRTVVFSLLGLVVMLWGIASLLAS